VDEIALIRDTGSHYTPVLIAPNSSRRCRWRPRIFCRARRRYAGLDRISGFSLQQHFRDALSALQTGPATVNLAQENFPSGLTHLQFKIVIAQALDQQGKGISGISLEIGRPDVGFNQVRVTRSGGFSEDLDAPPQTLPRDQRFPVIGAWQIRLPNPAQFAQLGDLRLFFMYAFEKL
jgi:hypothetical protein